MTTTIDEVGDRIYRVSTYNPMADMVFNQILIDARQLSVLVRNRKEGEEVTLTYLRGGKPATARVKLTAQDMPKFPQGGMPRPTPPRAFPRGGPGPMQPQPAPAEPGAEPGQAPDAPAPGPSPRPKSY